MNENQKVSLTAVLLNCICAIVFNINLFIAIAYGDTSSFSFILRIFCAVGWTMCAIIWIIRYIKFKKENN